MRVLGCGVVARRGLVDSSLSSPRFVLKLVERMLLIDDQVPKLENGDAPDFPAISQTCFPFTYPPIGVLCKYV